MRHTLPELQSNIEQHINPHLSMVQVRDPTYPVNANGLVILTVFWEIKSACIYFSHV
jgi:hypothetical protein